MTSLTLLILISWRLSKKRIPSQHISGKRIKQFICIGCRIKVFIICKNPVIPCTPQIPPPLTFSNKLVQPFIENYRYILFFGTIHIFMTGEFIAVSSLSDEINIIRWIFTKQVFLLQPSTELHLQICK